MSIWRYLGRTFRDHVVGSALLRVFTSVFWKKGGGGDDTEVAKKNRGDVLLPGWHNPLGDTNVAEAEQAVRRASGSFRTAARRFFAIALTVAGTFIFGWWFLAVVGALTFLLAGRRREQWNS